MEEPDPTVHDHLARTYFELGKTDEALLHMRKALNLDSSNQDYVKRLQKFEADKNVSQTIPEIPSSDKKKKVPTNSK
jgi:tetratricopeptide (TPR) repeat protein